MSERRRLGRRVAETRRLRRRWLELKLWPNISESSAYIVLNHCCAPVLFGVRLLFLIFHHRRTVWLINVYKKTLKSSEMCLAASVIRTGNLFHIARAVYITDIHSVYPQYVKQQEVLHRPEVGTAVRTHLTLVFPLEKKKGFYSQAGGKKLPKLKDEGCSRACWRDFRAPEAAALFPEQM